MAANFAKFSFCMEGKTIFEVMNHRLELVFLHSFHCEIHFFDVRKCCLLFVFLIKSLVANFAKSSFFMEGKDTF